MHSREACRKTRAVVGIVPPKFVSCLLHFKDLYNSS